MSDLLCSSAPAAVVGADCDLAVRPDLLGGARRYIECCRQVLSLAPDCALLRRHDPQSLPFDAGRFDAVVSDGILPDAPDYRAAIAEWFRLVRPGGHLVIAVAAEHDGNRVAAAVSEPDAGRTYTASALLAEVEEALDPLTFRVRHVEEVDGGPSGARLVLALSRSRISRFPSDAGAELPPSLRPAGVHGHERIVSIQSAGGPILERLLITKLDHRGDFILARPSFEALRAAYPTAHLTLACGPWNRDAAADLGLFDRIMCCAVFPEVASHGAGGVPDIAAAARRLAALLAGRAFDLAIDLRLHEDTRPLLRCAEATWRAGFGTVERFPFLDVALPIGDPSALQRADERRFGADCFLTRTGVHLGPEIVHDGLAKGAEPGEVMVFGPYRDLPAGEWQAEILAQSRDCDAPAVLDFDIASDSGRVMLGNGTLRLAPAHVADCFPRVSFRLAEPARAFELRLRAGPEGGVVQPFRFAGCRIWRHREAGAIHQEEMQFLLCALTALRMRAPHRAVAPSG